MSIAKFSKEVLTVFPSYNAFKDLDSKEQFTAISSIEKVLGRLKLLGIDTVHLLADNSLTVEGYNRAKLLGLDVKAYNTLPPLVRDLVLTYFLADDEERNKLIEGTFPYIENPFNKDSLTESENEMLKIINSSFSDLIANVSIPTKNKLKIILTVMALNYFNLTFDENDLGAYEAEYITFLYTVDRTEEQLTAKIESDLDYYWNWVQEIIEENRNKLSGGHFDPLSLLEHNVFDQETEREYDTDIDEALEEQSRKVMETIGILEAKSNLTPQEVDEIIFESRSIINFRKEEVEKAIDIRIDSMKKDSEKEDTPTLTEALRTLSKSEIIGNAQLRSQINLLTKEIENYMVLNAKALKHEINLIVNFYLSASNKLYKAMDTTNENKICLNVDLRNGIVDAVFKGQAFKLNGFFFDGELVKIRATEW